MASDALWMTAADAAHVLGVSRATLYAYVSRGYVRSQSMSGATRERGYSRDDVDRLRRRTEERRNPDKAAARALQWGLPILESSIALIDGNRLYYRGHDAVSLARSRSLMEVASLIWTGRFDTPLTEPTAYAAPGIESPRPRQSSTPAMARARAANDASAAAVRGLRTPIRTGRFDAELAALAAAEIESAQPRHASTPATARSRAADDASAAARRGRGPEGGDAREHLPFVARAQMALASAASCDPEAFDTRADSVARCGWRVLDLLTSVAAARATQPSDAQAGTSRPRDPGTHHTPQALAHARRAAKSHATRSDATANIVTVSLDSESHAARGKQAHGGASAARPALAAMTTIDQRLASAWNVPARGVDILRAALILCADHELNVSSFTARCVASAGSNPYNVVIAGLAALDGPRHGGASARVESMLDAMRRERHLRAALADRLRRGEPIHGFGHPLYRTDSDSSSRSGGDTRSGSRSTSRSISDNVSGTGGAYGDPRAAALLDLLRDRYPTSAELTFIRTFADTAAAVTRERPNIDFALAAIARVLRLPPGAPLTLFAIGRTIGWIGHAIEQYATGQLIRPRAKYVGVVPAAP